MKCRYCSTEHDNEGTGLCNNCWEQSRRGCLCLISRNNGWSPVTYRKGDHSIVFNYGDHKWVLSHPTGMLALDGTYADFDSAQKFATAEEAMSRFDELSQTEAK